MSSFITQCPHCETSFNITQAQLKLAKGKVRCGFCLQIFSALEQQLFFDEDEIQDFTSEDVNNSYGDNYTQASEPEDADDIIDEESSVDDEEYDDERDAEENDEIQEEIVETPEDELEVFEESAEELVIESDDEELAEIEENPKFTENLDEEDRLTETLNEEADTSETTYSPESTNPVESTENIVEPIDTFSEEIEENETDINEGAETDAEELYEEPFEQSSEEAQIDEPNESENDNVEVLIEDQADESEDETEVETQDEIDKPVDEALQHHIEEDLSSTSSSTSASTKKGELQSLEALYDEEALNSEGHNSVDTLSDEPIPIYQQKARSAIYTYGLVSINILLILTMTAQYTWANIETFQRNSRFTPLTGIICSVANCPAVERFDLSLFSTDELLVNTHPSIPDALQIDFIFRNTAEFEQAFPLVELNFSDLNRRLLANRLFQPEEYLEQDLQQFTHLQPNSSIQIRLEISDPGTEAVNYSLTLRAP